MRRARIRFATASTELVRALRDDVKVRLPRLYLEAHDLARKSEVFLSLLKNSRVDQNTLNQAESELNDAHQKLLLKWRGLITRRGSRPELGPAEGLGRQELAVCQVPSRGASQPGQQAQELMDHLEGVELFFPAVRPSAQPEEVDEEFLAREFDRLSQSGRGSTQGRMQQSTVVQSDARVRTVVENLRRNGKKAYKEAGGATGAKFLMDERGNKQFVAKSFKPPTVNLVHRTFQRNLPLLFDRFQYAHQNELVVPELAGILGVSPQLIPRSQKQALPLGEKGANEDFVLIDFQGGKKEFSKKGATSSKDFKDSIGRLRGQVLQAKDQGAQGHDQVTEAALFSVLIGNVDLHEENILINSDQRQGLGLSLIDFGLTMPVSNPTRAQKHKKPVFSHLGDLQLHRETTLNFLDRLADQRVRDELYQKITRSYAPGQREKIQNAFVERVHFLLQERRRMKAFDYNPTFQSIFRPIDPDSEFTF